MTTRKPTDVRRTEIADAALRVVATPGIAALSTRVLAEAVGLTTGALFKHFQSRDAMFLGMAERVHELLLATYPDAALRPRERFHRFAEARLTLVSGSAGVLTLVLSEQFALALPDDAVRVLRAAIGQAHAFVAGAIRDGQTDGSIRADVPAEVLALLFMGALQMPRSRAARARWLSRPMPSRPSTYCSDRSSPWRSHDPTPRHPPPRRCPLRRARCRLAAGGTPPHHRRAAVG